ncbi:MAG: FAD-dependent oxidoreductase [Bacteroidetes bacterium]|nr:FAD-dependent oxidoreductase [Bacteroidota bacterium]
MKQLLIIFFTVITFNLYAIEKVDVLIIGGGASGTTAGIQAARQGAHTLIIEEFDWLGGMLTSAGVSAVDGNFKLQGGLWGEFRNKLVAHYGSDKALASGWVSNTLFEPSVGAGIWKEMANKEKNLNIWLRTSLVSIKKINAEWEVIVNKQGQQQTIHAKIVIDGTELGDVAKLCGVAYDIGMDSRTVSGEDIAPQKANNIIQDLTYVAILKDYGRDVTIAKPDGYNPSIFYCTCKTPECLSPKEKKRVWDCKQMMEYGKLPNNKYMINWPIEGNDYYLNIIEMTPDQRTEVLKKAKNFTLCYLYYLQTALGFNTLGLADDEFSTADRLPFIPYYRESRRIRGKVRLNVNHLAKPYEQSEMLYRTGIAVGDYPVDHHHGRYMGTEILPDLHFYPVPSYSLPLGVMIPEKVEGLIVAEKSISVSNLVNGTTRLQPVVMQIGQAAGALAGLAIYQHCNPSEVSVRDVQNQILDAKGYLQPFLDLPINSKHFKSLQRIGSTGILKGIGKNVGWENQTWFYTDSLIKTKEFADGMIVFNKYSKPKLQGEKVTIEQAINQTYNIGKILKSKKLKSINSKVFKTVVRKDWEYKLGFTNFNPDRYITRLELAVLLDYYADPFNLQKVDLKGNFINNKSKQSILQ